MQSTNHVISRGRGGRKVAAKTHLKVTARRSAARTHTRPKSPSNFNKNINDPPALPPWKRTAPLTGLYSEAFPLLLLQGPPIQTDGSVHPIGSPRLSPDQISACQSGCRAPPQGKTEKLDPPGFGRGFDTSWLPKLTVQKKTTPQLLGNAPLAPQKTAALLYHPAAGNAFVLPHEMLPA